MDVSGYRLSRRYVPLLERVQEIADQAVRLVQQKMRERMPPTRIVVAAQRHCPDVVTQGAHQVLGISSRPLYSAHAAGYFGITTLEAAGSLVVINAGGLVKQPRHELDETVIHELVHAVQFGRPGARELIVKSLRNNYGVEKLTLTRAWKTNRGIAKDEAEAQALESLAREIR